jgi:hypothetical protein
MLMREDSADKRLRANYREMSPIHAARCTARSG